MFIVFSVFYIMSFGEHPQIAIAITVSQWCAQDPGNEWRAGDVMNWCAHAQKKRRNSAPIFFDGTSSNISASQTVCQLVQITCILYKSEYFIHSKVIEVHNL